MWTLPAPGTYSLSLAMGDDGYPACWVQCQVQFLDGSTVLATITGGANQHAATSTMRREIAGRQRNGRPTMSASK